MKIILLQDIKTLGKKGDIKDVAEGYARNFLLPRKMAEIATDSAIKETEIRKGEESAAEIARLEKLRKLADEIKNRKFVISAKAKDGKLFGSITEKDISKALEKENLEIYSGSIIMKEAIKKTGIYEIEIHLDKNVKTKISLEVAEE